MGEAALKVSVITCTHDRPEAMALCEHYVARQTVRPHEWIVADDGDNRYVPQMPCKRPERPVATAGALSLCDNMLAALDAVTGDVVVVMENDDWYSPNHIEVCLEQMRDAEVVGAGTLRYFNVAHRKYRVMQNRGSALCNTAFSVGVLPKMRDAVLQTRRSGSYGIDAAFWQSVDGKVHNHETVVGIKGMPGTSGLGIGHRPRGGWVDDPNMDMLRQWIGDDVEAYQTCGA